MVQTTKCMCQSWIQHVLISRAWQARINGQTPVLYKWCLK